MQDMNLEPSYFAKATHVLEDYGWYLLAFTVVLGFVYIKLKPHIDSYLQFRSDQAYAAKYHKDPDLVAARLAAQQRLIDKLQKDYDKDAENYEKKIEEKENKKRAEWLEKNESTSTGSRLGNGKSEGKPKTLKPGKADFSISDINRELLPKSKTSTRNYRPPKKSCCGKGGCG